MRSLLFLALLASQACGQITAVIEGPSIVQPGELAVLNSSKSVGDNHKWITPDSLSVAQSGCDAINSQVFFATPRPGKYTFILIVADKSASIEFARHEVEVKDVAAPQPPVNDDGEFALLKSMSKANSLRLNDEVTRKALHTALKKITLPSTLPEAQAQFIKAIEDVLLDRQRPQRNAEWSAAWRQPNNEFIKRANITDVKTYFKAVTAIIQGLE
jgi:hypothetical protein